MRKRLLASLATIVLAALMIAPSAQAGFWSDWCATQYGFPTGGHDVYAYGAKWNLLDGSVENALHAQNTPIGAPIHVEQRAIDFTRCVASADPPAMVAVQAGPTDVLLLEMSYRGPNNFTSIRFGTETDWGKWVVAHRRSQGEVISVWRNGKTAPSWAFDLRRPGTTGTPPGIWADSVGFVKPGWWGIASPSASFDWPTFWTLAGGMRMTFTWICDWCHI